MSKRVIEVTLDFETYFDAQYSLKKLNTMTYVRHENFEAQGVAIKYNNEKTDYYCGPDEVAEAMAELRTLGNDPDIELRIVAFNTKFDALIALERYNVKFDYYHDVMAMAKGLWPHHANNLESVAKRTFPNDPSKQKLSGALDEVKGVRYEHFTQGMKDELGEYCLRDVDATHEIFQVLRQWLPAEEQDLINLTTRMFVEPELVLDIDRMNKVIEESHAYEASRLKEMIWVYDQIGIEIDRKTFTSNDRFAKFLMEVEHIPESEMPRKISPRTGKETWAFAKNDVPLIRFRAKYPHLNKIFYLRDMLKSTIAVTRAKRLIEAVQDRDDRKLCVPLVYYQAHTGRYGGNEKLNLQNLQRGSQHRLALTSEPGKLVYVIDSSNIEARMLAWFARQESLLEQYRQGMDTYSILASKIYGFSVNKKDNPGERSLGKVACIAEGQRVLTDRGLVPIEEVTAEHKVWDGLEFVAHEGLVYQGVKEVITYDGLTATPDHIVFTQSGHQIPFGQAASQMERLEITGNSGRAIRTEHNSFARTNSPTSHQGSKTKARVYDLVNAGPRHRFTVEGKLVHNCLGLGYQMGIPKFQMTLASGPMGMEPMDVDYDFAKRVVDTYRNENPQIVRSWKHAQNMVAQMTRPDTDIPWGPLTVKERCIELPNGMYLQYPELSVTEVLTAHGVQYEYNYMSYDPKSRKWQEKKLYGGKLVENIIQALSRIVMVEQMLKMDKILREKYNGRIVLQVHDEIIAVAPEEHKDEIFAMMTEVMNTPPEWCSDLPLESEGGYDTSYSK